jgi:dihydrofolate synthase/folylpolyglutamate synthase
MDEVKIAAAKLKSENYSEQSFFEIVTAAAFKYFKQHEPEIVILETGLGGRLDATNVIKNPLLSIITNISLEHRKILGDNTAQIAAEKAGIIKENSKVITAVEQAGAFEVIKNKALEKNSKCIDLKEEYDSIRSSGTLRKNIITLKRSGKKEENYKLSLLGEHQAINTAVALRAVEELEKDYPISKLDIKTALNDIYWPGRMEKISEKPLIILDAAHNPAAFKELAKNINNSNSEFNNLHLIFSILKDKDLDSILEEFLKLKLQPNFYLAENSSFRSIKIEDLESKIKAKNFQYHKFNSLSEASRKAMENAEINDLIIVAGSFNTTFEAGIEIMTKKLEVKNNE